MQVQMSEVEHTYLVVFTNSSRTYKEGKLLCILCVSFYAYIRCDDENFGNSVNTEQYKGYV
jgi:hypothetical protein